MVLSSRSGEGAGTNCIPLCLDRSVETTNKQWGGVCFYIRKGPLTLWWLVRSSRDIELLTVSLRHFYLPCEFRQMCFTIIYIHLCDDASVASPLIADVAQRLDTICPDAQKCVIFDFKHLKLNICDKLCVHVVAPAFPSITIPPQCVFIAPIHPLHGDSHVRYNL